MLILRAPVSELGLHWDVGRRKTEEKGVIGQFIKTEREDSLFWCHIGNDDGNCYGP